MINEVFKIILSVSVSGSLLALILLLAKPLYKKRLPKSWQYYIWLVVLFRMLLPFTPEENLIGLFSRAGQEVPELNNNLIITSDGIVSHPITLSDEVFTAESMPVPLFVAGNEHSISSIEPTIKKASFVPIRNIFINIIPYLWIFWATVALVLLTVKIIRYHHCSKIMYAGRKEITDETVIAVFNQVIIEMNIESALPLYVSNLVNTPVLTGLLKPCIYVPESFFNNENYRMIFRHELTHFKRHDILYKWFLEIIMCLHWFNPLIYLIRHEINKNSELSCDEAILVSLEEADKRAYGDTLMAVAGSTHKNNSAIIYTAMSEDGKNIKERLESVMNFSKKPLVLRVLSYLLIFAVVIGAFFAGAYSMTGTARAKSEIKEIEVEALEMAENEIEMARIEIEVAEADMEVAAANLDVKEMALEAAKAELEATEADMKSYGPKSVKFNPDNKVSITNHLNNPLYTNLNELHCLVYNEAKIIESKFDGINFLEIEATDYDIKITKGGNELMIRYNEWVENEYLLDVKNGKLTISAYSEYFPLYYDEKTYVTGDWLKKYLKSQAKTFNNLIEIFIPEHLNILIIVESGNGKVDISDYNIKGNIELNLGNGRANITDAKFDGKLEINSGNGNVNLSNCEFNGITKVYQGNGRTVINNCEAKDSFELYSGNGVIDVKNSNLGKKAALYNGNGATLVEYSDAETLFISSNGDIKLSYGNFKNLDISASTNNVNVNYCTFSKLDISTVSSIGIIKLANSIDNYNVSLSTLSGVLKHNDKNVKEIKNNSAEANIVLSDVSGTFYIYDEN